MAPSVAPMAKETLLGFVGVDLRHDPLTLADQAVVRALNADFHSILGALTLRAGRTALGDTGGGDVLRTLTRLGTRRYQVVGNTLYRNFAAIFTSLASTTTTLASFQPLNDPTTWSFIADPNVMQKDDGTTLSLWGIVAPVSAPVLAAGGAGSLTGQYRARYTYARVVGSSVAHESNPCPAPAVQALSGQTLSVPVVASTDPQVTHIRLYRTVAGGASYLFDQQVSNVTATLTSSQADLALGTELETDNDLPPLVAWVVEFQGHLFLLNDPANPDYVWYSKRFRPEAVGTDQFLKVGTPDDPLQSGVALTGLLGVFSRRTKYRVFGNSVSGFTYLEALQSRGIVSPQALTPTSRGALFVARDGLFLTNFVEADVEVSQGIQPLFYGRTVNGYAPIDWSQPTALTLAEYKRRLYFGYAATDGTRLLAVYSYDTQHWYHYQHAVHRLWAEEDTDQLTMGDTSGKVWVLESGATDAGVPIALSVDLAPRTMGDRYAYKGFQWLVTDLDAADGTWTVQVFIDDALVTTASVTGTRQRRYVPLPLDVAGYTWQAKLQYRGTTAGTCYSVAMTPVDHSQGQVWVQDPANPGVYLSVLPGVLEPAPLPYRRCDFLSLDADGSAAQPWTLDLYLDQVLRATVTVTGARNKQLYRLPEGLAGYTWHVIARPASVPVPPLYGVAVFDTGPSDGQIWIKAPGTVPDTYLEVRKATQPLAPLVLKRFLYLKFDAETAGGTWTIEVWIDDVLRTTLVVSGTRNRQLYRLPPALTGYAWHLRVLPSVTTPAPYVFTADVLSQPLQVA